MMDWRKGFTAGYVLAEVDPATWNDVRFYNFTGGSISRSETDQSADLNLTERLDEKWIRIYLNAQQVSGSAHVALFTGITSTPERQINGTRESFATDCYSVLKPADDMLLQRGYYAPQGVNAALLAAELLRVGPAPVEYAEPAPKLQEPIIAEDSETNLTMAQKLMDAIGWMIRIDGMGKIRICQKPTEIAARFDAIDGDAIEPQLSDVEDWFDCPNCLRVSSGENTVELKDEDPNSRLSTVSRGREIWQQESSVTLGDRETLYEYTARKLQELQSPARTRSYSRRFDPNVFPGDLIDLHYPRQKIMGRHRVSTQTITIGYGCRTSEEAVYEP